MDNLKAGFSRANINPPLGISICGYYKPRYAKGILDDLELNALALQYNGENTVIITIDHCGINQDIIANFKDEICEATGVSKENIFISATHTHTAPDIELDSENELVRIYYSFVKCRIADVAKMAIDDLKPAKMGYGKGIAPNVAFIRRYVMKDGSLKTNPGVNNPDIVRPVGDIDESVNVIRFDREGAETLVFVNFANHPDVVGGELISADWPGLLRRDVEKLIDNTKCIFLNGAQGDINHVNVFPKPGDLNGMFMDFDDVSRGYAHAEYIARVVLGGVLQAYDKVNYVEVDRVLSQQKIINVPSNKPKPEDMPEARRIDELHKAGKDAELPYEGMMLTTVVAEAQRMVRLENAADAFDMILSAIVIGPVALLGIPGEPFSGIGAGIKATEGFDMVLPCCLTNGSQGYFPMQDSYDEGGYEARSSNFKAGVAEYIIKEGKALLESMRK